ncbi:MAG: hypothetical protein HY319_14510 [Armatimonadetes bacterium]|nr:hypothetical protein [Armatimonadota bacterium]
MKILTFTTSADELAPMLPLTREAYFSRRAEAMSIIWGEGEWSLQDNPVIQRYYREFSVDPPPDRPIADWIWPAARRALLEERPDLVVVPHSGFVYGQLLELCQGLGVRALVWDSRPPADVGRWLEAEPPAAAARPARPLDPERLLEPALGRLLELVPERRSGLAASEGMRRWLQQRTGWVPLEGSGITLALFVLAGAEDPARELARLRSTGARLLLVEAVNLPLEGRWTFRYGDYDNEFARGRASHDLRECLAATGPAGSWSAEILSARPGAAAGAEPLGPEAPDGRAPLFLIDARPEPWARTPWQERFQAPHEPKRHIVLLDSQNIAGSVLNHAAAINRHTAHQATSVCVSRHPFIEYPPEDCRPIFLDSDPVEKAREALEQADCLIFFEDDDETSPAWSFDLSSYLEGRGLVHLYVGYRVHQRVAELQRRGRRVLTPLPHLLRMFPQAHFYAGFPPATLDDVELRPPLSSSDGVVRVLHTPSLPHPTLSRYYYHKDTELFLEAARELSSRYSGRAEFWQIGGWPHDRILQSRLDCDITFNQLRGYHGLSGDEAMYLERPMVQAFDQFNINRHREYWGLDAAFPWLSADRNTLTGVLEELILDRTRRQELGRAGRAFMLEYFSPRVGILPLIYHCQQAILCRQPQ